jgi:energy-coupling factor transporter ATP-binding protein EcfA2
MKLKRLQVECFKNVQACDVDFSREHLIHAVIGSNGSGKSNLIEAIIHILIGFYFKKPPMFEFRLEYEAQNRSIVLQRDSGLPAVIVDGLQLSMEHFAARLRDGPGQVFYPELTFIYYSGECQRVKKLVGRYRRHFLATFRGHGSERYRPLFLQTGNEQSQVILFALFAHEHYQLLAHLQLDLIDEIEIVLRSPEDFDSSLHEPILWNTAGATRSILASLDETCASQRNLRKAAKVSLQEGEDPDERIVVVGFHEERTYCYRNGPNGGIFELARRLEREGENVYLALEHLRGQGVFKSISYKLKGRGSSEAFGFDHLSEGEKQLLAVLGSLALTHQNDNLALLDEPDTHLNPQWSWDYSSMLMESLSSHSISRSTVLLTTHDPVMISGMVREQVLLAHSPSSDSQRFSRPLRNPRGQGVANLLCSSEFFGLPSSLDRDTQELLDERLALSIKPQLSDRDKARLRALNTQLEMIPGISERDPALVEFLRQKYQA